jgi:hypothetical protein
VYIVKNPVFVSSTPVKLIAQNSVGRIGVQFFNPSTTQSVLVWRVETGATPPLITDLPIEEVVPRARFVDSGHEKYDYYVGVTSGSFNITPYEVTE